MAIFAYRLSRERRDISQIEMLGKFAGAVGNYNAHVAAYPEIKWPQIAEELVMSLGLKFNPYVPQVCYIEKVLVIHQIRSQVRLHIVQGNLGVANGDLSHLSTKLPISRWQVYFLLSLYLYHLPQFCFIIFASPYSFGITCTWIKQI